MALSNRTVDRAVHIVEGARVCLKADCLAVEEPLEIRVRGDCGERAVSVTMRTPGDDAELAVGFLFTEGLIRDRAVVAGVEQADDNIVVVQLAAGTTVELKSVERNFYMTSACGVCGKGSLDAIRSVPSEPLRVGGPPVTPALVHALPALLRGAQAIFSATGGLHAAGLFNEHGQLLALREDVGRHNALDKLIGARLLAGALPASDAVLAVSGRASFELVQKALMAAIPVFVAVGAPSSLAVRLAVEAGMTLIGFARDGRFNVYCGGERLQLATAQPEHSCEASSAGLGHGDLAWNRCTSLMTPSLASPRRGPSLRTILKR